MSTPPIPQRKPEQLDKSLLGTAMDLFSSPFGSGFSGSSSAHSSSGGIYATTQLGGDFNVGGGSAGQGAPLLNPATLIVLALVAGGIYMAGRK